MYPPSRVFFRESDVEIYHPDVFLSRVSGKGWGVFAKRDIRSGETAESCPAIILPRESQDNIDPTLLVDYYYVWDREKGTFAMIMGYGSFYNHSFNPNAIYVRRLEEGILDYVARRDIKAGEEITVNYNGDPECMDEVWFPVRD